MHLTEQDRQRGDFFTIAQVIVSGFGLLSAVIAAGLLLILGLAALFSESLDLSSVASVFSLAWVSGLIAALALPSLIYSFQRLRGSSPQPVQGGRLRLASLIMLVWPLVLVLGNQVSVQGTLTWLILPPLYLLAVSLPIWWLVEIARHRLHGGSRQHEWGVLNFSLLVTTPVVILVEIIVFGLLLILFAIWINSQPELIAKLEILAQRILTAQPNPESILQLARPYLQSPLAIFSILALMAGVVPLIEELLKPLALWTLANRRLTPAEGFAAGAICGGAFALLESLLSLIGPLQGGWAVLATGRAGTGLLHIATTALVGWALASAWQTGAYVRLGLSYLVAVGLHGLWNALSVFSGLGVLLEDAPENLRFLAGIGQAAPFGIVFLVLLHFLLLWGGNRLLGKSRTIIGPAPSGPPENDANQST